MYRNIVLTAQLALILTNIIANGTDNSFWFDIDA